MKKAILLSVAMLCIQFAHAQSKNMNTARNYFNTYVNYEKIEKKTTSLEKAKTAIDKAVEEVEAKKDDPKLKAKTVAKVWHYKSLIYAEMASMTDNPLSEGAADHALEAVKNSFETDAKGTTKKKDLVTLNFLKVSKYNGGIKQFQDKKYEESYKTFKETLDLNDFMNKVNKDAVVDTPSILMLAYSAQNANKIDEAIANYEKLIGLNYDDVNIYQSLSALYASQEKGEKAKEVIEKGKKRYPESNAFLIGEINYLLKEGDTKAAIDKMNEAVSNEAHAENASLYFALGTSYEKIEEAGMKEKAAEYYQKAIDIDPKYFDAYYNLGALYYNKAAEALKKANAIEGFSSAEQKKFKELETESVTYFKKALPSFEKGYELKNTDINTVIALKEIYANLGDLNKSNEFKARYKELAGK